MAIRTVTTIVTDESADAPVLAAAAALARSHDAHLDLFCVAVDLVPMEAVAVGAVPVVSQRSFGEARARAEAMARSVERRLPGDLRSAVEPVALPSLGLAERLARLARFSDLAVTGRAHGPGRSTLAQAITESLLFGTATPVLVVPDAGGVFDRPWERVALAWNDGDEALRAARAALPLLTGARMVDIVIVDPPAEAPDRGEPGGALSLWLSRHGVRAEVSVLARTAPRTSEILTRFAREKGAEALVMGAYGHSRLREAFLGGATREMLTEVPLPLVMAR